MEGKTDKMFIIIEEMAEKASEKFTNEMEKDIGWVLSTLFKSNREIAKNCFRIMFKTGYLEAHKEIMEEMKKERESRN